jgi:hypothetical protein
MKNFVNFFRKNPRMTKFVHAVNWGAMAMQLLPAIQETIPGVSPYILLVQAAFAIFMPSASRPE